MRLGACLAATAGAVALATAGPALAQGPEGSRTLSAKQAAQELDIYVECLVKRRERAARVFALAPFASPEQAALMAQVTRKSDEDCIQGGFDHVRISVRPDMLAGAIARQLVARDYPDLAVVADRNAVDVERERARAAQLNVAERFGRCIVWSDPAGVQALLGAEPGSTAERQAVTGLQQDMGMCVEEGSTLRLDRMFVRNIAAVSAYRLAHELRPRGRPEERG